MTHRFLKDLKERTLDEPYTAERSEIVDRIDQWEEANETQVHDQDGEGVAEGRTGESISMVVEA
jgi:hypothetical protein